MDMLIESTRKQPWDLKKEVRYTDTSRAEQERGVSIFSTPVSLVLGDSREKSYLMNFVDTPGHISLSGEVTASRCFLVWLLVGLRVSDGCLICVDVVEGVMMNTECCIRHAVSQGVPIVVAFTKMDRFITDLKLPPQDAYFKIVAMLEEVGLICLLIYWEFLENSLIHSFIHSFTHSFIHSFTISFISPLGKNTWHSLTHSLTHSLL